MWEDLNNLKEGGAPPCAPKSSLAMLATVFSATHPAGQNLLQNSPATPQINIFFQLQYFRLHILVCFIPDLQTF